ncbi:MAG TPA: glycine zipper 2TM domain-containing protein [Albitalea sp.]|nr:glycine zipper 2TM domain-containing protein [Albitalea sp.]
MTTTDSSSPASPRAPWVRNAWLIAGGLALTAVGLAAGLAWHPAPQTELMAPGSMEATKASLAANETVVDAAAAKPADATDAKPVPKATHGSTSSRTAPHRTSGGTASAGSQTSTPLATQPVAVCSTCGVVEGVREVQQKGKGTGLGAVAGGVVGGALGNNMGHGNGRALMTVLGAVGGGLAGNEIEKRARAETVYEVRVRMDDGNVRTLQQKTAPTPGSRVTVEGNTLHTARAGSGDGQGQMIRTSAPSGT